MKDSWDEDRKLLVKGRNQSFTRFRVQGSGVRRLFMELMNRIRERVVAWQKKRVRTVVFPLAGKLCAVETVEGKRLGQWQADYDGDMV